MAVKPSNKPPALTRSEMREIVYNGLKELCDAAKHSMVATKWFRGVAIHAVLAKKGIKLRQDIINDMLLRLADDGLAEYQQGAVLKSGTVKEWRIRE